MVPGVNVEAKGSTKLSLTSAARLLLGLPPKGRDKSTAGSIKVTTQRLRDAAKTGQIELVTLYGVQAVGHDALIAWAQRYGTIEMLSNLGTTRIPVFGSLVASIPAMQCGMEGRAIPSDVSTLQHELIDTVHENANLVIELNRLAAEVKALTPDANAYRKNRQTSRNNAGQPRQPRNKNIKKI
jgi:hypothetical protein